MMEEWNLSTSNFQFSEKQLQYKSGKELEKDGVRGDLFFYLATPKHDHFMSHELFFRAPPAVPSASVFAVVVDEQGGALKDINLLLFCDRQDRFVHIMDQPYFSMRNGATKTVKFRIETPSKCNMGKPFSVMYDVRDDRKQTAVQSNGTPPVFVQTKRGGTTAVAKVPAVQNNAKLCERGGADNGTKEGGKGHHHHTRPSNKRQVRNPYDAGDLSSSTHPPVAQQPSFTSSSSSSLASSTRPQSSHGRKRLRPVEGGSGTDTVNNEGHAEQLSAIVESLASLHGKVDAIASLLHEALLRTASFDVRSGSTALARLGAYYGPRGERGGQSGREIDDALVLTHFQTSST